MVKLMRDGPRTELRLQYYVTTYLIGSAGHPMPQIQPGIKPGIKPGIQPVSPLGLTSSKAKTLLAKLLDALKLTMRL